MGGRGGASSAELDYLNTILEKLSQDDYRTMKTNVLKVQEKVMKGQFVETAVKNALQVLNG